MKQLIASRSILVTAALLTAFLPGASAQTVVNSTWLGDGSDNFNNGNWSDFSRWAPGSVPNNTGGTVYDVSISKTPGASAFNGPLLDTDIAIRNLTLIDLAAIGSDSAGHNLTVTGSTTFFSNDNFNYGVIVGNGNVITLGTLTNFQNATSTLESGFLLAGENSTIQFRGANIVTNGSNSVVHVNANSQVLDQNTGLTAYRNLRTNNGGLTFSDGRAFTTVGDFTNDGGLTIGASNGQSTTFSVGGVLTNYDAASHTLSTGLGIVVETDSASTATYRFAGADIRSLSGANIRITGNGASITDLAGNNALRNLGTVDNSSITTATQFITPLNGSYAISNNSTQAVASSHTTTIQANYVSTNSRTQIQAPTDSANTTLVINGSAVFQGGGLDFGGQPGVNTQYHSTLQVRDGIEFRGAYLTGTGTTFADLAIINSSRVAPGASPGELTVVGGITSDATTLWEMQIGGLTAGTDFDRIVQTGSSPFVLGGELRLTFLNSFENAVTSGDTFAIMTSENPFQGAFSNVISGTRLETFDGLGSFQVDYAGNSVVLSQFNAVPEPSTWAFLVLGFLGWIFLGRKKIS